MPIQLRSSISITPLNEITDLTPVHDLMAAYVAYHTENLPQIPTTPLPDNFPRAYMGSHEGVLLVAQIDDEPPVGMVSLQRHVSFTKAETSFHFPRQARTHCAMQRLWVNTDDRHKGVGSALLTSAIENARQRRYSYLVIALGSKDSDAKALCEKHGFKALEGVTDLSGAGRNFLVCEL